MDHLSLPHLRVASGYSLRFGTATPSALVKRAAEQGHSVLGLVDRDGLYGAVQWVRACQSVGIAPIVGVDLSVAFVAASEVGKAKGSTSARERASKADAMPRVQFLARGSVAGWGSLCRLTSAAHARSENHGFPVLEMLDVERNHAHLVALLGPDSEVGMHLLHGRLGAATKALAAWRTVMGPGIAIAIANHRRPRKEAWSALHAAKMWEWGRAQGVRVVYAHGARYLDPSDARTADVLDATRNFRSVRSLKALANNGEAILDSPEGLAARVREVAELGGMGPALLHRDTWMLAEACALDPSRDIGLGSVFVPEFNVLTGNDSSDAIEHGHAMLTARCQEAIEVRYPSLHEQSEARKSLDHELQTIRSLNFAGYFLTVAEVVDLVKKEGIRVAARGSGAGSIVNYLLGISGVDPIQHGLVFERFLSTLRDELPDIDIDVESARRLEVYDLIYKRFGDSRVACVSMMDTYKVRQAIRDVGAALGANATEIDSFAKAFPHIRARNARSALADLPELRGSHFGKLASEGRLETYLSLVEALDGLPRHIAMHPCGVLLSDATLLDRTPVQPSAAGYPMSHYDKHDVEHMGLLKLDVLGVRMQSSIAHAVKEVHRTQGQLLDLDSMPLDDAKTFDLIKSTRTLGCFQIESPGQRELIGKFQPESFNDITIDISLFRPGPVKSDMITPFLRARHGFGRALYLHPDLKPFLAETEGVVVFHEQVMQIIATFTGCDLAEADQARKAMTGEDGIQAVKDWFVPQSLAKGYSEQAVKRVWEVLKSFASFGFCKAHAAAFALPTYESAWLKAHHPAAFFAGILTHDPGMYPKRLLASDARNFGVQLLGLDINKSQDTYLVETTEQGEGVRIPFTDVKGISQDEVQRLITGQPYSGLADMWQRARVSRPTAENLVLLGAFDALYDITLGGQARSGHHNRRDLLVHVSHLERHPDQTANGQIMLEAGGDLSDVPISGYKELTLSQAVRNEVELLGIDVSKHLISFYAPMLDQLGITKAKDLLDCRSEQEVFVAGVKVATQTPPIRDGKRVIFLTVDDETGPSDATFFPDSQDAYASTVFNSWVLLVRGHVRRTGEKGISIRATGAWELGVLDRQWREEGIRPVLNRLHNERPLPTSIEPQPIIEFATGFRLSPYADVQPAGPTSKLWHSSLGSSGR